MVPYRCQRVQSIVRIFTAHASLYIHKTGGRLCKLQHRVSQKESAENTDGEGQATQYILCFWDRLLLAQKGGIRMMILQNQINHTDRTLAPRGSMWHGAIR